MCNAHRRQFLPIATVIIKHYAFFGNHVVVLIVVIFVGDTNCPKYTGVLNNNYVSSKGQRIKPKRNEQQVSPKGVNMIILDYIPIRIAALAYAYLFLRLEFRTSHCAQQPAKFASYNTFILAIRRSTTSTTPSCIIWTAWNPKEPDTRACRQRRRRPRQPNKRINNKQSVVTQMVRELCV